MEQTRISRRELIAMLAAMGLAGTDCGEALAQDKNAAAAAGGKIVFENDKVRVIEHYARSRLGVCGASLHTHPPHLTINLTGGRIKIMQPDKEPMIRNSEAGSVFWDDSGPHAIQNLGSRSHRALLIEIKTV